MPAVRLQIVFQGGGAKISALMAVCSLLEKYESEGLIQVTRVGGSSAGAIAAAMYASSKSIEEYKLLLQSLAPGYIKKMLGPKWRGYVRVLRGGVFFHRFSLVDFFRDLFCVGDGAPQAISDLRIETEIYSTNIYSLRAHPIPRNEAIPTALANSCRIPYFFAGYTSENLEVDGGLALNLPVDHFLNDQSRLGPVIGISFRSNFSDGGFDDIVDYTGQLFSAAIESNVDRSRAMLGPKNVFAIKTSIGTFDFDTALKEGLAEKFDHVKLQFKSWLDAWLLEVTPPPDQASPYVYPILNSAPLADALVQELKDRSSSEIFTHALSMASYDCAILRSDGTFTGKYRSRFRNRYRIVKKTHTLAHDFQTGKASATFSDLKLRVMAVNAKGEPLKFATHVQEITTAESTLRCFRIYLLFDSALMPESPDQPYTVECVYEVDDPFPKLGDGPEILSFTRADGVADEIIVAAAFPSVCVRANYESPDLSSLTSARLQAAGVSTTKLIPSIELNPGEFISELGLTCAPNHYIFVGRRGTDIKQGETVGFLIE